MTLFGGVTSKKSDGNDNSKNNDNPPFSMKPKRMGHPNSWVEQKSA
jgi:hypothetical protein